jgi:tRNA A-37 threonylcarbamoyl transferase component Bud32
MPPDKSQFETFTLSETSTAPLNETTLPQGSDFIGQLLDERYLIEKGLGQGGVGAVYLARDRKLHDKSVVIKVLLQKSLQNSWVVQKFRQEVEALSRIDHPGVVGIIDSGELDGGQPFIVMQYVDGSTLRSLMKPEGMDLEKSADIIRQIGRALTAAHDKGIFHRDLKPENVMLQDLGHGEEQVKVIDFGIAKIKDSIVAPSTATNVAAGTVSYMAPEQLSGRPVSAATDVYALAEIAYEMLTGRKPFNPETGFELLEMQRGGVRIKPSDLRPSLSTAAEQLILKAISFEPSQRPTKARDFGDELARALNASLDTIERRQSTNHEASVATELAARPGVKSEKTIQATFPIDSQATFDRYSASAAAEEPEQAVKRNRPMIILLALLGVALLAFAGWYGLLRKSNRTSESPATAATAPTRELSYSLTVQKMRDGKPYQDLFESSGQEIFENGWKFRLNLSSRQNGYLYLLNEGPSAGGATTFNVLFPTPSKNSGNAYVNATEAINTGWMLFDEHQGTEKFWIISSANPVPELEAVRGVVNEKDKGTISDSNQSNAVRAFLTAHQSSSKPEVEKEKGNKQTNVRENGETLVNQIELEHH